MDRPASSLSAAEMQLVTLATLFHRRYKVIILDEPTARLSGTEVELLFKIIQRFREQGITIIYISHRLSEIRRSAIASPSCVAASCPPLCRAMK